MGKDMYMYVPKDTVHFISSLCLKLVDPENHLFIHGSRRFGYHVPESETDITIYMDTKGKCTLPEMLNLLSATLSLNDIHLYTTGGVTFTLKTIQEEYLDDFLPNEEGIAYFYLPVHRVHVRVYSDLVLFKKEKAELEYIENHVTDREIYNITNIRYMNEYPAYDGKETIDKLKAKYQTHAINRFKDWGGLLSGLFNHKGKICM